MSFESIPKRESGMNEALAAIAVIEAQIQAMGANDSEGGTLAQIRKQLEEGEITSEKAIALAEGLRDSKQDYH